MPGGLTIVTWRICWTPQSPHHCDVQQKLGGHEWGVLFKVYRYGPYCACKDGFELGCKYLGK